MPDRSDPRDSNAKIERISAAMQSGILDLGNMGANPEGVAEPVIVWLGNAVSRAVFFENALRQWLDEQPDAELEEWLEDLLVEFPLPGENA